MKTEAAKARNRRAVAKFKLNHPEKVKEYGKRGHNNRLYKYKHGITEEGFEARIANQNNLCPIGNHPFGPRGRQGDSPCFDHDHETGKERMILCRNHNAALGMFNDSIEELQGAIEYLVRFAAAAERPK